ncbi:MAG: hypothetical protein IT317_03185 [Anaerolineales bacterium]|nr:hypothetical protein [Anaerolineales bacterium]
MVALDSRQDRARRVRYAATLDALAVETNPRYQPNQRGEGETYCNLFVADAVARLGGVLPLYLDAAGGRRSWLDVAGMLAWLKSPAGAAHWRAVSLEAAQQLANRGGPVIALWQPEAGIGHVALVRPGLEPVGARGPLIAHAGARNANSTDAATGFGGLERLAALHYFAARLPGV